eukprot:Skav201660  [mRNA]  locus=scaffold641:177165:178765:- [translate_table: standard]
MALRWWGLTKPHGMETRQGGMANGRHGLFREPGLVGGDNHIVEARQDAQVIIVDDFVAPILVEVFSFSLYHIQTSSTNFALAQAID